MRFALPCASILRCVRAFLRGENAFKKIYIILLTRCQNYTLVKNDTHFEFERQLVALCCMGSKCSQPFWKHSPTFTNAQKIGSKKTPKNTHISGIKKYTFCLENLSFGVMCVRVGVSFCASVFLCCFCWCCDNAVWASDDIGLTFDTNTPKLTRRWRRRILCYHWQQCSVCLFVRLCQCLRLKLSIKQSIACIFKAENEDKLVRWCQSMKVRSVVLVCYCFWSALNPPL